MDPFENAKLGNVDFFNQVELDLIQNFRSEKTSASVLALSAGYGKLNCCKVIYERCPELLYKRNSFGGSPLHAAVEYGHDDVVEFLLSSRADGSTSAVHDIEAGVKHVDYKLLMMVDSYDRTALHGAVQGGRLSCAKLLLNADKSNNLLRMVDKAGDAAIHIAVRDQKLEIVKLLLESQSDPAFVYSPDNSGDTPHLIALQKSDKTAVAIRKLLVEKQPEGCKTRTGERGWALLHHATSNGDVTTIEDILEFSPECAELVDSQGQNFVHLAAKLEDAKVIRHIMASPKVDDNVLNQQDTNGNTPFHIATSKGNANVGLAMVYNPRINKFALNKQGKTALAAINFDYDKRRAGVHGFIDTDRVDEKDLKDRSDFDLLVGALISTVSFTVGITVPGGYFQEGPNEGTAVLYKKASFEVFVVSNTIALALSLYSVFSHFCTRHLTDPKDIIYHLQSATFCSLGSIFAMMVAFITGSYAVLAVSDRLAITVCVICCCFFGFAIRSMCKMIRQKRKTSAHLL